MGCLASTGWPRPRALAAFAFFVLACIAESAWSQTLRSAEVLRESWWRFNRERYLHPAAPTSDCMPAGLLGPGGEVLPFLDRRMPSEAILRDQVIPSLLRALRNQDLRAEPSVEIVSACLLALARAGGPHLMADEIRAAIAPQVESADPGVREAALLALGVLRDERSLPRLQSELLGLTARGELEQTSERLRACAALALGLAGVTANQSTRQTIVDTLLRALEDEQRPTAARSVDLAILMALGLTPLPVDRSRWNLAELGSAPRRVTNLQEQLLWLFHRLADASRPELERAQIPWAISRLSSSLSQGNPLRRAVAARLVTQVRSAEADMPAVRAACILALGACAGGADGPLDAETFEVLLSIAADESDVRCSCLALMALGQIAGCQVSDCTGAEAASVISARSLLIERLRAAGREQRPWAGLGLALLERGPRQRWHRASEEGRAALLGALAEAQDAAEFSSLVLAIGLARLPDALDALHEKEAELHRQLRFAGDWELTGATARTLGLLDDRASVPALLESARRDKYPPDIVRPVAEGLSLLADGSVPKDMVRLLGKVSGRTAQAALADSLGRIGDVRTIAPLIALLEDEEQTDRARGCAASALGWIADKSDVPWTAYVSAGIDCWDPPQLLSSAGTWTGLLDRFD